MAFGQNTFTDLGAGVSDIFAGIGDFSKAAGSKLEGQAYEEAAQLALQNEQFTKESTAIKEAAAERELYGSLGRTKAAVAGAGLSESGSALDILRESAQQGATTAAAVNQQGLITEAGFQEQAQSYELMASAAEKAASADSLAGIGSFIGAGINAVAGVATFFTPK